MSMVDTRHSTQYTDQGQLTLPPRRYALYVVVLPTQARAEISHILRNFVQDSKSLTISPLLYSSFE